MKSIAFIVLCAGIILDASLPKTIPAKQMNYNGYIWGKFKGPFGITVNQSNEVLVADDLDHQLFVFSETGELIRKIGSQGSQALQYAFPDYFIQGPDGLYYVADTGNNRIQILDRAFEYKHTINHWGLLRKGFANPRYIAFNSQEAMFVTDWGNHCIRVFWKWQLKFSFGKKGNRPGEFHNPIAVAVGQDGQVYVSDFKNHRIQVFDRHGNHIFCFGKKGSENGQFINPSGLTFNNKGLLFIADRGNHRVQAFAPDGTFLYCLGGFGSLPGHLNKPTDVAFGAGNKLFIADSGNHRIQVFKTESQTEASQYIE